MSLTRDQIFSARPKTVPFEVPDWGGTVHLKPLSVAALGSFMAEKEKLDGPKTLALLVSLSACDAADGSLLFDGDEDRARLEDQPFDLIKVVADEVMRINKIGEGTAEKKDDAVPPA